MSDLFLHEASYRGQAAIERLATARITICGAGALGSLVADNLVRQGVRLLTVIDHDRVEAHNIGTQLYRREDVGALKVEALRVHCFRATGVEVSAVAKRLEAHNAGKLLRGADLVLDTFDNSASRRLVTEHCQSGQTACLHLGLNADYGQVHWNEVYRVPADVPVGTANNACEYPLARNLILLVAAAGCEAVLRKILEDKQENYSVTLRDLQINLDID